MAKREFVDVRNHSQGKKGTYDKEKDGQWYLADGVNYSGRCENPWCAQHGKKVMCRRGFGEIDALGDKYRKKIVCPECGKSFACQAVYLSDCQCLVTYQLWAATDDAPIEKVQYSPQGDDLVTLGKKNGKTIFEWYSLLDFECKKH